ncbi:DMT family transporter [Nereida sp. MMG025]|uniref:DMT family transporter n=1 Tax=Nereida sp. MMG025 TaxID=2909981 RepID=UPI001F4305A9|nr:DMT family transporter [Nereida sp. MMG025]MCF6444042.1 DMT family transporter [Nereida sp. MMG025]
MTQIRPLSVDSTPSDLRAVVLMVLATAFIAGTTLMAKTLGTDTLGPPLHPLQISHGRFVFALIVLGTYVGCFGRAQIDRRPAIGLHIGRTVLGWAGVTLMFAAAAFIPLADATAISFLNPVFGMIFAFVFLRENVGPWRWIAAIVAMGGAAILLRPTPDSFQPAALFALGAALFLGLELIFIKKLSARENPLQILLVNNALGCIIATCAVLFVFVTPTMSQWMALATLGALMACAQFCFVSAMRRADASYVVVFSYATLIFATLYDFAFFNQRPDAISILGSCIILAGAVLLAWREAAARARQS